MKNRVSGAKIRQDFIDFFIKQGHTFVPSASLVPGGDPTLLFTNAGMVQFKDVFLGIDKRSYSRAVNSQKCMRVAGKHNDLEDVGRDDSHHTFFEMLGNWSFGDYYKKEAISWAWELLTKIWGIEKTLLWATCFKDEKGEIPTDEEAAHVWKEQPGFIKDHLVFLGRKENFWEMADTGPCGPCSEIYIDLGKDCCDKKESPGHVCEIGNNCSRYLEFWNLVFIQYNRISPSELIPLPARHVDTGMGLDRLVSILQGKRSNYLTDLFIPLMDKVMKLAGQTEKQRSFNMTPYRVIADHSRAATFLIADGVVPGNIGRNYICRMIIRRASRFGGKLGLNEPFLAKVAEEVIDNYGNAYPELVTNRETILKSITLEEERFHATLESGLSHLQIELDNIKKLNKKILDGKIAFDLYATHGLPFEIARDVAREQALDIEEVGFRQRMETHRINSGAGKSFDQQGGEDSEFYATILDQLNKHEVLPNNVVEYDPYSETQVKGKVLKLISHGKIVNEANQGDEIEVILPKTCFYIESGGQISDTGVIRSKDNEAWNIRIDDVRKPAAGVIIHIGLVTKGNVREGDLAIAMVNEQRRKDIMRNHTATHLLHAELRKVLGKHVRQAGSLVAPDRLRFDFTHPHALTTDEIERVERGVNQTILQNYSLIKEQKSLDNAIKEGAMALFGEKYGNTVRTIFIGNNEIISYELCGGTHVNYTGDIGTFIIIGETSIASGIRRIEAITGVKSYEVMGARFKILHEIASSLSTSIENAYQRVNAILIDNEQKSKEINDLTIKLLSQVYEGNKLKDLVRKDEVFIYTTIFPKSSIEILRGFADRFRDEYKTGVMGLASIDSLSNQPIILISVTEDLVKIKGINAVDLVRESGKEINGGGGGKPTLAQAGGSDASKLQNALDKIKEIVLCKI